MELIETYKKKFKDNKTFDEVQKKGENFLSFLETNQDFKDDMLEKYQIDIDILFNQDHPDFKKRYGTLDL